MTGERSEYIYIYTWGGGGGYYRLDLSGKVSPELAKRAKKSGGQHVVKMHVNKGGGDASDARTVEY